MFIPIIPGNAGKPIAPYVQGAMAGQTLYVAGMLSLDEDGRVAHDGDAKAQTRNVIEQIKAVVNEAGGELEDVVYNMIFISDVKHYADMNEVYSKYFPNPPARYCIVSELVKPGCIVEIASVAYLGPAS